DLNLWLDASVDQTEAPKLRHGNLGWPGPAQPHGRMPLGKAVLRLSQDFPTSRPGPPARRNLRAALVFHRLTSSQRGLIVRPRRAADPWGTHHRQQERGKQPTGLRTP